ncbi:MAG: M23 family metallopeptidase [Bacteroidia bacterium]
MTRKYFLLLCSFVFILSGCNEIKEVIKKSSPHEVYTKSLVKAGLEQTALGRQWQQTASAALSDSLIISLPYQEEGYFFADKVQATGLRFTGKRGQKMIFSLETTPPAHFRIFMDLFILKEGKSPEQVAFLGEDEFMMEFTAKSNAEYLLRMQPELLKGGRYTLTIRLQPSLGFPVAESDTRSILSFWADPRDGGARSHEGVDVFAPRGTPVVAVSNGIITRTGTNRLGGKVVWLRGEGASYYYAHLDSQMVGAGKRVNTGDTLGLVGNTGNARYTAHHLHFGIYTSGGAIDPLPFIDNRLPQPAPLTADISAPGKLMRVTAAQANLRRSPENSRPVLGGAERNTPFTVLAATEDWFRIQLPDMKLAYFHSSLAAPAGEPFSDVPAQTTDSLYEAPAPSALLVQMARSASLPVYGRYNEFYLVKTETDNWAWKRE